jgi:molybdopterin converting factor small subunit
MSKTKEISIFIPTPLRTFTDNQKNVSVTGENIDNALQSLIGQYPRLKNHLFDDKGVLRNFVNVYLNNEDIRYLNKEEVILQKGDSLAIVPSIAGGKEGET